MATGDPGTMFGRGPLAVALITLLVPLSVIVLAAAGRPAPAPALPAAGPVPLIPGPLVAETLSTRPAVAPVPPVEPPSPSFNPFPRWMREESLNVLLLGIDRRAPDEIYRTDTIVVASIDLRTKRATL